MRTVVLQRHHPGLVEVMAERRRLGLDRHDELWDGELHTAPGPTFEHGSVDSDLMDVLKRRGKPRGLRATTACNVGTPTNYRVPDGGLHHPGASGTWLPTAALVAEVLSPGDETYDKFGHWDAPGVEEVVVADPATRTVRVWQRQDGHLVETGTSSLLEVTGGELEAEIDWPA